VPVAGSGRGPRVPSASAAPALTGQRDDGDGYRVDWGFGVDLEDYGAQKPPRSPNPPRYPAGRPPHGALAYQAPLSMAACIWHNWASSEPVKRLLIAIDN
jgi:hypothetical protein